MKVFVATSVRVIKKNDRLYVVSPFATILKRYYDAFGDITLCTRIINSEDEVPSNLVEVTELVNKTVPLSKLTDVLKPSIKKQIKEEVLKCDVVITRVHSFVPFKVSDIARKVKKPYYVEVMGCAWDANWNHSPKGKAVAPYMFLKMKQVVKNADYALYVTNEFLQKRYPCKNESVAASNVLIEEVLPESLEKRLQKTYNKETDTLTLMTTANTDVKYKGQEYVIRAIPALNKEGIKVKYVLAGGGDKKYLKSVAEKCGVEKQIEFLGALSRKEVFDALDKADIYLQPSLQEGLPRAVIEAMSRALPVIGARTAGIPELINDKWVVKRKSHTEIAEKIIDLIKDDNMKTASKENFEESKKYLKEVLDEKRKKYFDKIREEIL